MLKQFLHVGCGQKRKVQTTQGFQQDVWKEIRLDIAPEVEPDIVGSITAMPMVVSGSMDAVFSSHNIEHLYAHEVGLALAEFRRVLKPDGFLVLTCPDLQSVCQRVAEDRLAEPLYVSPAGPIAPLDILYGHRPSLSEGHFYMAHRCGFTLTVLLATLQAIGFGTAIGKRREPQFDLWVVATALPVSEDAINALAIAHFPY